MLLLFFSGGRLDAPTAVGAKIYFGAILRAVILTFILLLYDIVLFCFSELKLHYLGLRQRYTSAVSLKMKKNDFLKNGEDLLKTQFYAHFFSGPLQICGNIPDRSSTYE